MKNPRNGGAKNSRGGDEPDNNSPITGDNSIRVRKGKFRLKKSDI